MAMRHLTQKCATMAHRAAQKRRMIDAKMRRRGAFLRHLRIVLLP
jgi:hypothetical protein